MRQHYSGETTASFPIVQTKGRHRAAAGERGHFTYGAIREVLSFDWLLGKRRKLRSGARFNGITDKILAELQRSHQDWLQHPISQGRHHFTSSETTITMPVMEPVGV